MSLVLVVPATIGALMFTYWLSKLLQKFRKITIIKSGLIGAGMSLIGLAVLPYLTRYSIFWSCHRDYFGSFIRRNYGAIADTFARKNTSLVSWPSLWIIIFHADYCHFCSITGSGHYGRRLGNSYIINHNGPNITNGFCIYT